MANQLNVFPVTVTTAMTVIDSCMKELETWCNGGLTKEVVMTLRMHFILVAMEKKCICSLGGLLLLQVCG